MADAAAKPLPPDFKDDSGVFFQRRIGIWTAEKSRALLGSPRTERAALDDSARENGRILAFADPSGRYKQLELDFDKNTGLLRTVYVYPWKLSWQECQRRYGTTAKAAEASRGRVFYSYADRHLDVLVAPTGDVINLGLY